MNDQNRIKAAFERMTKAYTRRPTMAQSTSRSTTRIVDGLTCEIQEGDWQTTVDMPKEAGGKGGHPTPGVLGRAALGSCLAVGLKLWAAKLDVPISSLEVTIDADSDDRGLFGTADVLPGYSQIRYTIQIESSARENDIMALIEQCEQHSPWLDNFKRPVNCIRDVEIIKPDDA